MAMLGENFTPLFGKGQLKTTFALLIFYGAAAVAVHGVTFEEDVRITMGQKNAVEKFRSRVTPYITEDFMKDELYLVKWLRSTAFDITLAEKKFIENIRWRKENKISRILSEDFSDIAEDYPYTSSGFDKDGRPLFIGFAGEWDLRAAVVTGRAPRVLRYLDQAMEDLIRRIRKFQFEGKNITQAVLIVDLASFSLVTHGCVPCLLRLVDFLYSYENHYPGLGHRVYFTNAPPTVQVALGVIRANVCQETRDAITVFGFNKDQFSKILKENIDAKYLPRELGGNLERN